MVTPRGAFPGGGIDGRDRARLLPPDAAPYQVRRTHGACGSLRTPTRAATEVTARVVSS
ncbi:hypothetical protein GCM10023199_29570 [Actinomycetospora chibensis]